MGQESEASEEPGVPVRITDLGAPYNEPPPGGPRAEASHEVPPAGHRHRLLAVVVGLVLAGTAYASARVATLPPPDDAPRPSPAVPEVDEPLRGCDVHPGACPSPQEVVPPAADPM